MRTKTGLWIGVVIAAALAGAYWGPGVLLSQRPSLTEKVKSPAPHNLSFDRVPVRNGRVRVLYAVLDADGVYFGDLKVRADVAGTVLHRIAEREGITAVSFHITGAARYGDAVKFYAAIDRTKLFVAPFPTYPAPDGFRLPLVGVAQKQGACWYDVENKLEPFSG